MSGMQAHIEGTITIGTLNLPLTVDITPGHSTESIEFTRGEGEVAIVQIGEILEWVAEKTTMKMGTEILPEELRDTAANINKLVIMSNGTVHIDLDLANNPDKTAWNPKPWQPFKKLPLEISGIKLKLDSIEDNQ